MVLGPRLEHYLIAPAEFTLIASRGRCESARTHQNTLRDRKHLQLAVSDEWCSEIFIGPCSADGRGDGRVVPKTAPAVHPAGEHPRNVRSRSNGPWQQLACRIGSQSRDHMQCEVRSYLVAVQIAQLTQSEPVPVRDLRSVRLAGDLRHRSFDDSSARVDVVHDVESRSLVA